MPTPLYQCLFSIFGYMPFFPFSDFLMKPLRTFSQVIVLSSLISHYNCYLMAIHAAMHLEKEVLFPLTIFIKTVLLGTCTGIFVDSTPLRVCRNQRIHIHRTIETVNDELKNIAQTEHSRHRSFDNFIANALSAIAAYCFFEKKPAIEVELINDGQVTLF